MYIFFIGIFLYFIAINLKRAQKKISFSLKPNCLMTRYPLIFIPGKTSFFYCLKYWNNIPLYLKEHGYEAFEARLNWLAFFSRKKSLQQFISKLSKKHKKFHLVFDPSAIADAHFIEQLNLPSVHKIHILTDQKLPTNNNYLKIQVHNCINDNIQTSKKDYIKIAHDMFTLSPVLVSSHLLGSHSEGKNLTVEPHILNNIIKIAENDWV